MYDIEQGKAYRLVDVRDHRGISKATQSDLYSERVGCVSKDIQMGYPHQDGRSRLRIEFIQDSGGNWINRRLHTSPVNDIRESNGGFEVITENSVYVFEPAELKEPEYQDEAEVIELYLTTDAHYLFCTGIYYDAEKKPHELVCHVHLGMFQDSCLICLKESRGQIACRYFPHRHGISFYNTIYRQQDYSRRLLIHNVGKEYLKVAFDLFKAEWRLAPGEKRWITPYDKTGADETYEDEED